MKIYKYTLAITDEQVIEVPLGAKSLYVAGPPMGENQNWIFLWVLLDPEAEMTPRKIWVHGTGHDVVNPEGYLGTARTHGNSMVWHVFEEVEETA